MFSRSFIYGYQSSSNNNRVTVNVSSSGFTNLAKGFGFQIDPNNCSSDGYPLTTPATFGSNPSFPLGYYGQYVWKWTGTGTMLWSTGPPLIVASSSVNGLSSGVIYEMHGATSGDTGPGAATFADPANLFNGLVTPRLVFSIGWNIQSITNSVTTPGLITINTKTNYVISSGGQNSISTSDMVNISGANSNTGANGSWAVTNITASSFDLVNSTFTNSQLTAVGTANYAPQNQTISLGAGTFGSFSGMSGLVICKISNESLEAAGQIADPVLVSQLQQLKGTPAGIGKSGDFWLRFMDASSVQSNFEGDFAQRIPATYCSYNVGTVPLGYWVNTITNTGSDVYTCSNPSASGSGAYKDNEIVIGKFSASNSTGRPTLNVNGRGAKPIYSYIGGLVNNIFRFSGPPASSGLTMQWSFQASWLNGGTSVPFSYNTVSGDTVSVSALNGNLGTALAANSTLSSAGIVFGNSGQLIAVPRTGQAGTLTVTYTSGPAICTMIAVDTSTFSTSGSSTLIYNYLLDSWIYRDGGLVQSNPLEYISDLCNRVGANCWYNWGTAKGSWITAVTNYFATNLNGKFGTEIGNEIWNFAAFPAPMYNILGFALGFANGNDTTVYSYGGLRMCQYAALSKAAWSAAGRNASDHFIISPSATFDVSLNGNFDTYQMKGTALTTANTIYSTYGGLNGTDGSTSTVGSFNTFPNRPVDITTATGCAPYWSSHWLGNGGSIVDATSIKGTVVQNAPWLQAALDYSNGNTVTAFTSMVNQFTEVTGGGSGNGGYDFVDMQNTFTNEEAMCAQYDGARPSGINNLIIMDYECGPSWGVGNNGVNGINPQTASADANSIATQMSNLGWNISAYGSSYSDVATKAVNMFNGWKLDIDHTGTAANTGSYKNMIKTNYYSARNQQNIHREAHAAQFAYSGPNQWCLFPGDYNSTAYTSFNAIAEFNA